MTSIDSIISAQTANAAAYGADAVQALNQALTAAQATGFAFPRSVINWASVSATANDPGLLSGVPGNFVDEYNTFLPLMEAVVNSNVNLWEQAFAPQYSAALSQLESKLQDGLARGTALPADYDAAIYAAAQSKVEKAFNRSVVEIEQAQKRRGFEIPPSALTSGIANAAVAASNALAEQATAIYIKRSEQEIQHIQFCMAKSSELRQAHINNFVQYATIVATINKDAIDFGKAYAEFSIEQYRSLIAHMQAELEIDRLLLNDLSQQATLDQARNEKAIDATLAAMTLTANITKDVGALFASMASAALASQGTIVSQASTV